MGLLNWTLPVAGLLWLSGGFAAAAAGLAETVPGHPGLTYFDLMKLVITDLAPATAGGATGETIVPLTHIEGKDAGTEMPETVGIDSVEIMPIPGDAARIIVLADVGRAEGYVAEVELLALFALTPAAKLLDVVEVGNDRWTGFAEKKPVLLAPGSPLIMIYSGHSNSNQSYQSTEMIFVRDSRFRLIDSILTFNERYCLFQRTQEPIVSTLPDRGPYRAVHAVVRETTKLSGEDCGDEKAPRPGLTTYQATYRWDARRQVFVASSRQLSKLAAENIKRF